MANARASLDDDFDVLYAEFGRPSIAPERLIRASLLQILCSARSERQLMEPLDDNLLFRWFVGLGVDDAVWVPTVFSRNRDRLLTTDMSRKVMAFVGETVPRTVSRSSSFLAHREVAPLLSDDHFSVDGTLVKAWASMKSVRPKEDGRPPKDGDPPAQDAARKTRPRSPVRNPARCPALPAAAAMPKRTSRARNGPARRMPRRPIRRGGSTGSRPAPARCCASRGLLSWI